MDNVIGKTEFTMQSIWIRNGHGIIFRAQPLLIWIAEIEDCFLLKVNETNSEVGNSTSYYRLQKPLRV